MSAGNRKRAFVGVAVVGFRAGGGRLPQAPTSAPTGAASTSAAAAAAAARRAVRCMRVTARRRPVVSAARRRYVSGAIELANAYLVHLTDGHWGWGGGGGGGVVGGGGGIEVSWWLRNERRTGEISVSGREGTRGRDRGVRRLKCTREERVKLWG